jgi:DNA-binding MarR family transcriptional regulator
LRASVTTPHSGGRLGGSASSFDELLAPSGLRTTQHGLLTQIEVMGSPALGELAEVMVMDASALSHTLRPLIRDGLVSFVVDDCDRRRRRIVLTEAGKARLEQ